jgi:hypothetical protein
MGADRAVRAAGGVGLGLLAVWLFAPMATPVPVEGFSASIGSIALHLTRDRLANYDRLFPFNLQFFAFSRLGANLAVAALVGPLGLPAEWALRALVWIGAALLASGSYVLARRWTDAPPLAVAAILVLIPGLAESGFFYNDNLLSAGLAAWALALLELSAAPWATLAAGLLFGWAVLSRTDAVLLAPAAALILWRREGIGPRLAGHLALFGAVSAGLAAAVLAGFGVTPLQVLRIASHAVALWRRDPNGAVHLWSILQFCGPACLILSVIGLQVLAGRRDLYRLALIFVVPVLYNLVYLDKVWEARQLAPLTPFVAAAALFGLQPVFEATGRTRRLMVVILAAVIAPVLLAPPGQPVMREGPRAIFGRLWTPLQWWRWQASVRGGFDMVGQVVDQLRAPVGAIVTDNWDPDRYLHLQLQEHGFAPIDIAAAHPACAGVAEGFARGGVEVAHIRLHTPFLVDWALRLAPRLEGPGRACLAELGVGQPLLITELSRRDRLFGDLSPDDAWTARSRALAAPAWWLGPADLDPPTITPLSPELLAAAPAAYRRDANLWLQSDPLTHAELIARPVDANLGAVR